MYHAAFVLRDVIRQTDLTYAPEINDDYGIYLKTENPQVTSSFEVRGAYYKISCFSPEEKERGVVACSAGDHAQGAVLAATRSDIQSCICIPDSALISKVEATRTYSTQVELADGVYDDAYQCALQIQEETGSTFIHPFDDEDVMASQGTIGLEILGQLPDVDTVIVPIGGGGLIPGVVYAIKSLSSNCKVYGVQSNGAPPMIQVLAHHQVECLNDVCIIADGIAVKQPGDLAYSICDQYADGIVTITDDEISTAILTLIEQQKLIAGRTSAASVAVALFNELDLGGKEVVCLVSGGNIDVTVLSRIINRGLSRIDHSCDVALGLIDKPGQLKEVPAIVADMGSNVVAIRHDHSGEDSDINGCALRIMMETRNRQHIEEIRSVLLSAGYRVIEH